MNAIQEMIMVMEKTRVSNVLIISVISQRLRRSLGLRASWILQEVVFAAIAFGFLVVAISERQLLFALIAVALWALKRYAQKQIIIQKVLFDQLETVMDYFIAKRTKGHE